MDGPVFLVMAKVYGASDYDYQPRDSSDGIVSIHRNAHEATTAAHGYFLNECQRQETILDCHSMPQIVEIKFDQNVRFIHRPKLKDETDPFFDEIKKKTLVRHLEMIDHKNKASMSKQVQLSEDTQHPPCGSGLVR